jgi:hypothetical protein
VLDTFVLARAAAMHYSVAVHRMREADWFRVEQLYELSEGVKPPPAPVAGTVPVKTRTGFFPTAAIVKKGDDQ